MSALVIRKCYPEHVLAIDVHRKQRVEYVNVALSGGQIALHGVSKSGWVDNRCVWAGGLLKKWDNVGFGWCLFGKGSLPYLADFARCAREVVLSSDFKRVEFTVEPTFEAGHRWAKSIGLFTLEAANLRCYGPGGRDMALYAYIRGAT